MPAELERMPTDRQPPPSPGKEEAERKDCMSPSFRKAFEESWKRHEEAMRRLAKL